MNRLVEHEINIHVARQSRGIDDRDREIAHGPDRNGHSIRFGDLDRQGLSGRIGQGNAQRRRNQGAVRDITNGTGHGQGGMAILKNTIGLDPFKGQSCRVGGEANKGKGAGRRRPQSHHIGAHHHRRCERGHQHSRHNRGDHRRRNLWRGVFAAARLGCKHNRAIVRSRRCSLCGLLSFFLTLRPAGGGTLRALLIGNHWRRPIALLR